MDGSDDYRDVPSNLDNDNIVRLGEEFQGPRFPAFSGLLAPRQK
jgi:hypothetical protein